MSLLFQADGTLLLIRRCVRLDQNAFPMLANRQKLHTTDVLLVERKQHILQLRLALSRLYKLHHIVLSYRMLYGHLQNVAQPLNAQL